MNRRSFLTTLALVPFLKKLLTRPDVIDPANDEMAKRERSLFEAFSGPPGSDALIWIKDKK